jgi:hypothetical protein
MDGCFTFVPYSVHWKNRLFGLKWNEYAAAAAAAAAAAQKREKNNPNEEK